MDEDLAAEIARMEAELARDDQLRAQQQQQQQPSAPSGVLGVSSQNPFAPQPQPQQQQHLAPQTHTMSFGGRSAVLGSTDSTLHPFNDPFSMQQASSLHAQQQQQQQQITTHVFSKDSDGRSVFVGNLPKGENGGPTTTPEELAQFFSDCGQILNCTVLKDRFTQELKGVAYIEFASYSSMGQAIDTKNNTQFKGNTIIVTRKRSNFKAGRGRGRGGAGRGRMPDPYQAIAALMGMMAGGAAAAGASSHRGGRGRGRGGSGGFQPF